MNMRARIVEYKKLRILQENMPELMRKILDRLNRKYFELRETFGPAELNAFRKAMMEIEDMYFNEKMEG